MEFLSSFIDERCRCGRWWRWRWRRRMLHASAHTAILLDIVFIIISSDETKYARALSLTHTHTAYTRAQRRYDHFTKFNRAEVEVLANEKYARNVWNVCAPRIVNWDEMKSVKTFSKPIAVSLAPLNAGMIFFFSFALICRFDCFTFASDSSPTTNSTNGMQFVKLCAMACSVATEIRLPTVRGVR